jgi:hypothetical protein
MSAIGRSRTVEPAYHVAELTKSQTVTTGRCRPEAAIATRDLRAASGRSCHAFTY